MRARSSQLGIILLTLFIDMVGFGLVIPVLPLYAEEFGAGGFEVGLLLAIYSACQFVFAPVIGRISDRVGRRPVLIVSVAGTAAGHFMMGFAGSLAALFAARVVDGISGANIGTAQAYIADITPPAERSRAMGLVGAIFGLGFIFGPFIGGELAQISPGAPFIGAGILAVINLALIIARLPESLHRDLRSDRQPKRSIREVFRHANGPLFGAVLAAYFVSICGFQVMTTVWALFLKYRFGYDEVYAGRLFAFIGAVALVMQGVVLRKLLKAGSREATLALIGAAVLSLSLMGLDFAATLASLMIVSAGVAIGNSLLNPTLNGLASLSLDATWQGRGLGLLQSAGSLGRTIGPLGAGYLLAIDSGTGDDYARAPLLVSSAILGLTFLILLAVRRQAARVRA